MSIVAPQIAMPGPAPLRADHMGWTVLASVGLHLVVFAVLLLPRLPLAPPPSPPPVNVDLVTARELASLEPSSSDPSSTPASSASSSQASEAPSSGSSEASSSPSASAPPSQAASSAEASSQAASSAAASSEAASSSPPPASASVEQPPKPFPAPKARKVIIPVGPEDSSSEVSSATASSADESSASEASSEAASSAALDTIASLLTAAGEGADGASSAASETASAPDTPPMSVVGGGQLHAAHRFYLKEMLAAPALSQAKQALKQLPPERRLAQTCNIEASGQAGGAGYAPDAIIANAFAAPEASGTTYSVSGGVFRADGHWFRMAYQCTLDKDLSNVSSFSFHIGSDVTTQIQARLGNGR